MKKLSLIIISLLALIVLLCSCEITVEYKSSEGGVIIGQATQSAEGEDGVATFEAVMALPNDGYQFVGWDDGVTTSTRTDSLSESKVITALFERIPYYKISYYSGEGGGVYGVLDQTLEVGSTTSAVEAIASEGYRFIGWDDGVTEAKRTDVVTGEKSITALFEYDNDVTVEYKAGVGGRIEANAIQCVERGTELQSVTAIADEGYRFERWSDGLNSYTRKDTSFEDATFTAYFIKLHTVTFKCNDTCGEIEGETSQLIEAGDKTVSVTAKSKFGYKFISWSNGQTDPTIVIKPTEDTELVAIFAEIDFKMPVISIDTQNNAGINNTTTYVKCNFNLSNTEDEYKIIDLGAQIRGRGNTSWTMMPKKSYRLKLDHPVSLFGLGKGRDWALIANYCDKSLIRNYLAYSVALEFSTLQETSRSQLCEVYLNGEYQGVYLLCEQIEVGSERVDIHEGFSNVDTGYLIELDGRYDGTYVTVDDKTYVIKSPDTDSELFTEAHKEFIADYLTKCLDALKSSSYAKVNELMDVESFAQAYIVFELFKCADVGGLSFFMHKDAGDKLECGPIWDFDLSVGNINHSAAAKPYNSLYVRNANQWFNLLFRFDAFKSLVAKTLKKYAPKITECLDRCYKYVYALPREAFDRNFEKWDILGKEIWSNPPEIVAIDTWEGQVEYTRTYLANSLNYLLKQYPSE